MRCHGHVAGKRVPVLVASRKQVIVRGRCRRVGPARPGARLHGPLTWCWPELPGLRRTPDTLGQWGEPSVGEGPVMVLDGRADRSGAPRGTRTTQPAD